MTAARLPWRSRHARLRRRDRQPPRRIHQRFSALDQQLRGGPPIFQEQFRRVAISRDGEIIAGAAGSPGSLAIEAGHVALFARETAAESRDSDAEASQRRRSGRGA